MLNSMKDTVNLIKNVFLFKMCLKFKSLCLDCQTHNSPNHDYFYFLFSHRIRRACSHYQSEVLNQNDTSEKLCNFRRDSMTVDSPMYPSTAGFDGVEQSSTSKLSFSNSICFSFPPSTCPRRGNFQWKLFETLSLVI